MQKNRFIFGVRTPKVVQATGGPKLSARMTTSVEVGFTVTRKKAGESLWEEREGKCCRTHSRRRRVQATCDGGQGAQEDL